MQEIVFSVRYVSFLSHAKRFMWADSEIGCLELPYGYVFLSIEYRRYNVLAGKMPDCPEPRLRVRGAPRGQPNPDARGLVTRAETPLRLLAVPAANLQFF